MIMLFLTLGWRESFVAAASIPLSFLIAFIGLNASGNTINFISLFSLILAIGILVDSGIVVVEAMHTRLIKYGDKRLAAIHAIREYAWPLIAGTFTTVAVFVPLFFLSGILGKFLASIPFTVIFVLIASIFVALGLVPLIAMYVIRAEPSALEKRQEEYNELAKAWYEHFLRNMLGDRKRENRFIALMIGLFILALSLPAVGLVKVVFFPPEHTDLIYVEIEKPLGSALTETDLSAREVEELLYADTRIESFVTEVGAGSSFGANASAGSKLSNITINLREDRAQTSQEIVTELRKTLSSVTSARVIVTEPEGGPPSGSAVSITYSGEDLGALGTAVERAARVLSDIPGTTNIDTSVKD
ncbi:MAG: efflux RND transporter permease subunit, partial [Rectinemataceae bacterium]|nr:efflux RND transporter permease subunit [Rectinemataceae bacterium]